MTGRDIITLVAAFVVIGAVAYAGFVGVPYQDDIFSAGTKLVGALFVVTVFVERSTAMLNSIWYGEAVRKAEAEEEVSESELKRTSATDADRQAALAARNSAIEELARLDAVQDRVRMIAGFFIALFVSAAGVRTLEGLQTLPKSLPPSQLGVYHAIDMLITAGLIAGGSEGIHAIADLLGRYVQATRQRLR
jgi:hypothetical protein